MGHLAGRLLPHMLLGGDVARDIIVLELSVALVAALLPILCRLGEIGGAPRIIGRATQVSTLSYWIFGWTVLTHW